MVADSNDNGVVNNADYLRWYDSYGDRTVVVGDFAGDETVDAADYTVWRDLRDAPGQNNPADANGDAMANEWDYLLWVASFEFENQQAAASATRSTSINETSASDQTLLLAQFEQEPIDTALEEFASDQTEASQNDDADLNENKTRRRVRGRFVDRVRAVR